MWVNCVTRKKAVQFSDAVKRGCEVCCLRKREYHFIAKDIVIFPDSLKFCFLGCIDGAHSGSLEDYQ